MSRAYDASADKLRPFDSIEPHEWARLERARRTTDPRKLAAMMPAWLKAHCRQSLAPARTVFDMRTYVPFAGTRRAADTRKPSDFPDYRGMSVAEYVREIESTWNLRHVPTWTASKRRYQRAITGEDRLACDKLVAGLRRSMPA